MKISNKCCGQCLFSKNKIVSDDRKEQLLDKIKDEDSHFICHKATIANQDIVCRGFYENKTSNLIRISERLNMIEFVDVEQL